MGKSATAHAAPSATTLRMIAPPASSASALRGIPARPSLGDFDVRHGGAVAVVDDDGALVQFVEVLVDCSLCERDEHVESVDDALDGVDGVRTLYAVYPPRIREAKSLDVNTWRPARESA